MIRDALRDVECCKPKESMKTNSRRRRAKFYYFDILNINRRILFISLWNSNLYLISLFKSASICFINVTNNHFFVN